MVSFALQNQEHHRQSAEIPKIIEIARGRKDTIFFLHHRKDGQAAIEPLNHGVIKLFSVLIGHNF